MSTVTGNTLMSDFLQKSGGVAVIDGGLATELERYGADLNDPLWSAKCLVNSTHLIRQVHLDYLEAGADIIITASYQATIQGFEAKGYSSKDGETMLRRSVEIAIEARDAYYQRCIDSSSEYTGDGRIFKHRPILVAASVGSYGAYLADGSEYSGDYGDAMNLEFLKDFHRRRVQVLAESGADLIAFETVPNKLEAQAFAELLDEGINIPAWFAFNSKDGVNVVSGDSLAECTAVADSCNKVVAVGINCTPPRYISGLISTIKEVTTKPILIYPNSGESYNAQIKQWVKNSGVRDEDFVSYVNTWCEMGASLIGGCCRTTPDTIRAIHKILPSRSAAFIPLVEKNLKTESGRVMIKTT
ncbi:homocysteine S-methyltransferase 2-like [Rutidosis leptorrhynchoides]|uniref:homocysteine S-methyltransferase 2-like n=1 Tax=Rutidosis leptorrhynchoides TaxID=125765 RepID=UPI003A999DC0